MFFDAEDGTKCDMYLDRDGTFWIMNPDDPHEHICVGIDAHVNDLVSYDREGIGVDAVIDDYAAIKINQNILKKVYNALVDMNLSDEFSDEFNCD